MNGGRSSLALGEASKLIRQGSLSAEDLYDSQRARIERFARLNAFITVLPRGSDRSRSALPILGATVALKDNIFLRGHRTTAGSNILRDFVPSGDADVAGLLMRAGARIIGKTNLHEFAFGVTNVNPHFGDCRNPWREDSVSGGSSGGSAVAVARGMASAAVGTDTAGSVRIPAALCGVVGYKPSYGLISRRGIVPLAWSLDTVGFLTSSVADAWQLAALTLEEGSGSILPGRPRGTRLNGLRLGVPRNILGQLDEGVRRGFERGLASAEEAGASVTTVRFKHFDEVSASRSLIAHAEAASYHRQYVSKRFREYGRDLKRRLSQGLVIPAAAYLDAQRVRGALVEEYRALFRTVDMLALPTTRIPSPTLRDSKGAETEPEIRTALLALTEPFNLFGAPAVSIPCGVTGGGLPVGFQLAGDLRADAWVLSVALSLERLFPRIALED